MADMISSAHLLFLIGIVILVLLGNVLYYTLGVGSGSGRQVSLLHVRIEKTEIVCHPYSLIKNFFLYVVVRPWLLSACTTEEETIHEL